MFLPLDRTFVLVLLKMIKFMLKKKKLLLPLPKKKERKKKDPSMGQSTNLDSQPPIIE